MALKAKLHLKRKTKIPLSPLSAMNLLQHWIKGKVHKMLSRQHKIRCWHASFLDHSLPTLFEPRKGLVNTLRDLKNTDNESHAATNAQAHRLQQHFENLASQSALETHSAANALDQKLALSPITLSWQAYDGPLMLKIDSIQSADAAWSMLTSKWKDEARIVHGQAEWHCK